jgi:hypothetical protein
MTHLHNNQTCKEEMQNKYMLHNKTFQMIQGLALQVPKAP